LDNTRKLVTRDARTSQKILGDELQKDSAKRITRYVELIKEEQNHRGLLLLDLFYNVINFLVSSGCSLPFLLSRALGDVVIEIEASVLSRQTDERKERIRVYQDHINIMERINECIGGRSKKVIAALDILKKGLVVDEDLRMYVQKLKDKYDEDVYIHSEKAYPYLLYLNSEDAPLFDFDVPISGRQSILQSFMEQVDDGFALSSKQLNILRNKVVIYGQHFEKMSRVCLMPTADVLGMFTGGNQSIDIVNTLRGRGIDIEDDVETVIL